MPCWRTQRWREVLRPALGIQSVAAPTTAVSPTPMARAVGADRESPATLDHPITNAAWAAKLHHGEIERRGHDSKASAAKAPKAPTYAPGRPTDPAAPDAAATVAIPNAPAARSGSS